MERERLEKLKQKAEKEKLEKDKQGSDKVYIPMISIDCSALSYLG